jgi:hypothetical protein
VIDITRYLRARTESAGLEMSWPVAASLALAGFRRVVDGACSQIRHVLEDTAVERG